MTTVPKELLAAICRTENAIAPDIPLYYDNEDVAEACINCLDMHGGTKAQVEAAREQLTALIDERGYSQVLRDLAPHISV